MINIDIPCWIISLKPEAEQTRKLQDVCIQQGVKAEIFPAIDGREGLPQLQPDERLAKEKTQRRHLCEMKNSEIGCYLSHLRAIKQAYADGHQHICLLEDDVWLEDDFSAVLKELITLPDEIEMVRLMGLKVRRRKPVMELLTGRYKLVRPERGWLGTQAYVMNRVGMKKFLAHSGTIFEPIDKVYDHFWEFSLHVYGVEPHLVWEVANQSSILKSNIAKDRVTWWLYWLQPLDKAWRSLQRHWYLWRHRREFYPAEFPKGKQGKSERLRY